MENRTEANKRTKPWKALLYLVLILASLIFIYPLIWLVVNSFKTNTEIFSSPWGLPEAIQVENYAMAWKTGNVGRYFLNSLIVTGLTLSISIILSSMAAYGVQRMKWKLSGLVMTIFMLGMMIPIHATLIPLFLMFRNINITDSLMSLVLPYVTFSFPSSILILSGFLSTIPRELEEAAVIDGSSLWRTFIQIILPVARPAVFTVVIFNFISTWNELLVALIFISNPDKYTLPVGLTNFVGQYTTNYAPMLAAIVLAVIPSVVIYSIFNTKIVAGMTAGAVKG